LKGKVEIVSGQFNNSTGAISMRAKFPNTNGLLRSGITGKIRIPQTIASAVVVPQASTFELQDKVMVFVLDEKNIVNSAPIQVAENYGNFYLVKGGLKPGQRIAYAGIDRLRDGAVIQPQPISADSLLKTNNFNQ
jgi:membrane fusion protein (multidrug efflux system)